MSTLLHRKTTLCKNYLGQMKCSSGLGIGSKIWKTKMHKNTWQKKQISKQTRCKNQKMQKKMQNKEKQNNKCKNMKTNKTLDLAFQPCFSASAPLPKNESRKQRAPQKELMVEPVVCFFFDWTPMNTRRVTCGLYLISSTCGSFSALVERLSFFVEQQHIICCDLQNRKIYFKKSKTLVGRSVSRPTVTRVTFDLPECKEALKT